MPLEKRLLDPRIKTHSKDSECPKDYYQRLRNPNCRNELKSGKDSPYVPTPSP